VAHGHYTNVCCDSGRTATRTWHHLVVDTGVPEDLDVKPHPLLLAVDEFERHETYGASADRLRTAGVP
jgi:hypothetical protein